MVSKVNEELSKVVERLNGSKCAKVRKAHNLRIFHNEAEECVIVNWAGRATTWTRVYQDPKKNKYPGRQGQSRQKPHRPQSMRFDGKIYFKATKQKPKSWELSDAEWESQPLTYFVVLVRHYIPGKKDWVVWKKSDQLKTAEQSIGALFWYVTGNSRSIPHSGLSSVGSTRGGVPTQGPTDSAMKMIPILLVVIGVSLIGLFLLYAKNNCITSDMAACKLYESVRGSVTSGY